MVIPKAMRDRLGVRPGDEVRISMEGESVRVESAANSASLRGSLSGLPLVTTLQADRRREREE